MLGGSNYLLQIDNNIAERSLRAIALRRKNYLFAGSHAGGERAAAIYALIGTCKLNGMEPPGYLRHVLSQIADHRINRIDALLPWNLAPIMGSRLRPRRPMPASQTEIPLCEVKITLRDTEPEPWRRVLVRADITLDRLHTVIQNAMGWSDSHLHEFEIGRQRYGKAFSDPMMGDPAADERKIRLINVAAPKTRFIYRYDFGDGWEHEIKIERVLEPSADVATPVCLAGEFACPPEDCGGTPGYGNLLAILAGPDGEEKDEMLEWIGGPFDPLAFDLDAANKRLARLKPKSVKR